MMTFNQLNYNHRFTTHLSNWKRDKETNVGETRSIPLSVCPPDPVF